MEGEESMAYMYANVDLVELNKRFGIMIDSSSSSCPPPLSLYTLCFIQTADTRSQAKYPEAATWLYLYGTVLRSESDRETKMGKRYAIPDARPNVPKQYFSFGTLPLALLRLINNLSPTFA